MILWRIFFFFFFTFYHFDSYPRFPPFLLYVRWKFGVTFVLRCFRDEMGPVTTKPVFRFLKAGCTATIGGLRLEILDLRSTFIGLSIYTAKIKKLISARLLSCTVTTRLICAFLFTFAKSGLSCDAAQMYYSYVNKPMHYADIFTELCGPKLVKEHIL